MLIIISSRNDVLLLSKSTTRIKVLLQRTEVDIELYHAQLLRSSEETLYPKIFVIILSRRPKIFSQYSANSNNNKEVIIHWLSKSRTSCSALFAVLIGIDRMGMGAVNVGCWNLRYTYLL